MIDSMYFTLQVLMMMCMVVDNCSGNENQLDEKYTDQCKATNSSQDLPVHGVFR